MIMSLLKVDLFLECVGMCSKQMRISCTVGLKFNVINYVKEQRTQY